VRLVFFGSPEFAVPALRLLAEHHDIALVVTQPDRPKGRGQKLAPTPVKQAALELGLPCTSPVRVKGGALWDDLRAAKADYFIVTAYGRILPAGILEMPLRGSLNIHPSRLPLYRGPAPVNWAHMKGDDATAVTIMEITREMDAGDIVRVQEVPIDPAESGGQLLERCAHIGARLLDEVLLEEERTGAPLPRVPQDHDRATYAPFLTTEMAQIDWSEPAHLVAGKIRAMDPRPGAWTMHGQDRVKLFAPLPCAPDAVPSTGRPGQILGLGEGGLVVACGEGAITIRELQLPSRRRMPTGAVLAGRDFPVGSSME